MPFCGFLISLAMKVTLFQASLENKVPFMETATAPRKAMLVSAVVTS